MAHPRGRGSNRQQEEGEALLQHGNEETILWGIQRNEAYISWMIAVPIKRGKYLRNHRLCGKESPEVWPRCYCPRGIPTLYALDMHDTSCWMEYK
jgi:hypothetical protein